MKRTKKEGAGGESLFNNTGGKLTLSLFVAIVIIAAAVVYFLFLKSGGIIVSEERLVDGKDPQMFSQALEEYIGDEVMTSQEEDIKSEYSRLLIWNFFNFVGEDPLPFMEDLRDSEFTPELRVESGFGFSNEIYDFFEYDYADSDAVRKQARLLKQAGVNQVQVYLLRWSEIDSNGVPFDSQYEVNDRIVKILTEEGLDIHVEFFTHHTNLFESKAKNPNTAYPLDVPSNQIAPLAKVVEENLVPQFQDYVIDTVRRYPQIKSWGFMNEVDQLNAWDFDDLIIMQNAYYQAVKEANPDALVGAAGPTFPELLAPKEKLNPEVSKALDNPIMVKGLADSWGITYPEVYDKWKKFYDNSRYDFVQIHQLGVGYWPNADWYYDTSSKTGKNSDALQWELVKSGVDNMRQMVGELPITSQVDVGVHDKTIKTGSSEYWQAVQSNFREAASGKYGFDFMDIYHMRVNWYDYYDKVKDETIKIKATETYIFDKNAEPSLLYETISNIYLDYSLRLSQEYVAYFFSKFYPDIISVNGKVGIGTNNPSEKLDVIGYVRGSQGLCIGNDCRAVWPTGSDNGNGVWNSGIGGIFYNGGKVGIGISTPTQKLEVRGKIKATEFCLDSGCISTWPTGNGAGINGTDSLWSTINEGIYYNGGNIGVGTDNPLSRLSVGSNGFSGVGVYTVGTKYGLFAASSGDAGLRARGGYYGAFGVGTSVGIYGSGGPTGVGIYGHNSKIGVRGDGTIYDFYAGGAGTDYGTASSMRWKDNVVEIDPQIALNKILQIKGSYFDWNIYDDKHDLGFIAEEIGQIVPEVVQYETDLSDPSNWYVDENGIKRLYAEGVDYGALTPMLVQAIKGQQEIIDGQNELISSINEKLNVLCSENPTLC